jgi:hypothetical protein
MSDVQTDIVIGAGLKSALARLSSLDRQPAMDRAKRRIGSTVNSLCASRVRLKQPVSDDAPLPR